MHARILCCCLLAVVLAGCVPIGIQGNSRLVSVAASMPG